MGNVPAAKAATSTTATGGVPWGLRAAATVQPVQTSPPPTASSASPLSAAARQTAEIRPLPNFVATVLPTTTAGVVVEPQASSTGSSYLSPLNAQHVETTTSLLGSVQTVDSQPLSAGKDSSILTLYFFFFLMVHLTNYSLDETFCEVSLNTTAT